MEAKLTKTQLLARGWTNAVIKTLNPTCETKEGKYGEYYLYSLSTIEALEKTPEYTVSKQQADSRKAAANKAKQTKTNKWQAKIAILQSEINALTPDRKKLTYQAIRHYNDRTSNYVATVDSDATFLERITVNYIRHQMTSYDQLCEQCSSQVGVSAYKILREAIDRMILVKYGISCRVPWEVSYR